MMNKMIEIQDSVSHTNITFLELKFYIDHVIKSLEEQSIFSKDVKQAVIAGMVSRELMTLTADLEERINNLNELVR